ncbi:chromosome segregation protein SMC [Acidiphilium sp. AL]|uniref:Chromosome partition protein Smc n=1 Tax=Acidiphilium iwatense TaxID=768198 RepID=A0ABS9DWN5_9PROT|nr:MULTISPECIES: chromosome segregation protein SMC [Acidiphilium]MCF3945867.1 chromosome segregation protein SMC [Acidiphilium iwatense]MCU4159252.1 chromosome segregation protein SMC [Acidiphilium sp. AL]
MPARFARLRIAGFKSFADATTIDILPGLTGIVGPNGCGKSNVVDALRWAMGEASAKSLRGGEMDDVIFAGTMARPARSLAEVAVILTETAGLAPAPFQAEPELEISRKIERGSGSLYRVNGRETRARDVATLFADLASGARSSALISQGKISALVNARPEERRAVLEEAAGITGLHSRRHEAELKLRAAEQNLTRAADLRGQQESRLAELRKQARQANRYRNLSGAIRDAEAEYLAIEKQIAEQARSRAQTALTEAEAAVAAAQTECNSALADEGEQSGALPALRAQEAEARTGLERARIQAEQVEAEIVRAEAARTEAESRLASLIRDHDHAGRLGADATAAIARLTDERERLETERAAAPGNLAAALDAAARGSEAMEHAEQNAQQATEMAARLGAVQDAINLRLKDARNRATQAHNRATEAVQAHERARAALIPPDRLAAAEAEREAAEAERQSAETSLEEAQNTIRHAEAARLAASAKTADVRSTALATEAAHSRLLAEADALAAILAQKFGRDDDPILDSIDVPEGMETALGAVLREELAAGTKSTAARFWRSLPAIDAASTLHCLSERIEAPDELRRALDHILLLPEGADGDALQTQLTPGQSLVASDGAVWRWDGFVTRAGAPTEAAIRLAQRNRLAVLRREVDHARDAAERAKADRIAAEQAELAARKSEDDARARRKTAESRVDRARTEARIRTEAASRLATDAERLATREATCSEDRTRLEAELADARKTLAEAEADLAGLADAGTIRQAVEQARLALGEARRQDAAARQQVQHLRVEAEQLDKRLGVVVRERADWTERARDAGFRTTDLAARLHEARTALEILTLEAGGSEARDSAQASLRQAEAVHREAASALASAEAQSRQSADAARRAEQQFARARETLIGAESVVREANHAWGTVAERILERLGVEAALPPIAEATAELAERARKRFERLTKERDEMGPVNLRAEIEVAEIEARIAAIERDRDEIATAIAKLRGSIGHLNREGRERLSIVFTEIDRHFQALFTRMFGGGRAHLALTGSDDPLEAGLEIFAEPPGKKLATLSLLSGGEQALTALSLIFGVFRCNPAPISVLDEVDAPLDDANVGRFCTLLDDMVRDTGTRFLVVTHHHLTMARMDRLYGVTMQERGVSRLLSVDLGAAAAMVDPPRVLAAE